MATTDDSASRKYGVVVVGGSGYTGRLVCSHIAATFPTDLRWAIAGRSAERLGQVAAKLKKEHPDRVQPELEIVTPDDTKRLAEVIGRAKVCISTVLYAVDGENVVRACVEQGTDYVDCAAVPTICRDWIDKFDEQAKEKGVALIESCGFRSAIMDFVAIHACREISEKWSTQMGNMTMRIDLPETDVSGGTVRTMVSFASEGSAALAAAAQPSYLSPIPYTNTLQTVRGIHKNALLGRLTYSSPAGDQTRGLVLRSWGLLGGPNSSWGPNFQYNEYEKADSYGGAILNMVRYFVVLKVLTLVQYKWFRNLVLRSARELGTGPSEEDLKSTPLTAAAFVEADPTVDKNRGKGCLVELKYTNGGYPLAALLMAQAAATLLYERNLPKGIKGGCLTAGVLGPDFVDRVVSGGLEMKTTMIENYRG
ncbi:Saccharopine dehydrogenase-domain-containing protein [Colletotrichum navitas]|uniref:Saccharopine dehydrogenase-domain-containing protein n=1 Tax=Colletotrichum navitas TaxID=681940 RepID=A0AAD8PLR5_9PEZI|nr:Saccharopine dehydrogenase-domain-containing protein [Colletotrichum navitas]KAK1569737.1 Saccharopine dehydrogenase-domain-containing protein [Colletotrichum navitas]